MSKAARAYHWFRDIAQVVVLDRFNPQRRHLSEAASTACRSLNFHSRCKIRAAPMASLLELFGCAEVQTVTLPGPSTVLGDVGSQTGYHALGTLVRGLKPKTILEFGTYLGVSAYTMALNALPETKIFTVDLPDEVTGNSRPELDTLDQQHVSTSRHRVGEAFLHRPERERITQIRADSLSFRAESVVSNVDLVYVDGGHSLPVATKDTENAFRVLSENGTIVWDDYFHLYPDVVTFLDGLADRHELHGIAGTNYVVFSRLRGKNLPTVSQ
jgi:hypothetical protein